MTNDVDDDIGLPEIPRIIEPAERTYAKGSGSGYREFNLLDSDLRLHVTHQPDDTTAIILAVEGEESASIIADADDKLRVNTPH
jgi:hypothetical protein